MTASQLTEEDCVEIMGRACPSSAVEENTVTELYHKLSFFARETAIQLKC
jgi:hypothetical protein